MRFFMFIVLSDKLMDAVEEEARRHISVRVSRQKQLKLDVLRLLFHSCSQRSQYPLAILALYATRMQLTICPLNVKSLVRHLTESA
jgi:hypothetical protein